METAQREPTDFVAVEGIKREGNRVAATAEAGERPDNQQALHGDGLGPSNNTTALDVRGGLTTPSSLLQT